MADATITVQGVVLHDNWPGTPVPPPIPVTNMESAVVGHNAVAPLWKLGTKWEVYCKANVAAVGVSCLQGFSTFIYLRGGPDCAAAVATVVGALCVPDETLAADDAGNLLYAMASDKDVSTHENTGLCAVALSTITNDYYAWYWCGGVCPIEYCPSMSVATTLETDDSVVASCELSTVILATGGVGFKRQATDSQTPAVGFALYADGA